MVVEIVSTELPPITGKFQALTKHFTTLVPYPSPLLTILLLYLDKIKTKRRVLKCFLMRIMVPLNNYESIYAPPRGYKYTPMGVLLKVGGKGTFSAENIWFSFGFSNPSAVFPKRDCYLTEVSYTNIATKCLDQICASIRNCVSAIKEILGAGCSKRVFLNLNDLLPNLNQCRYGLTCTE